MVVRTGAGTCLIAVCDLVIGVAAVATATAALLPWCTATLRPQNPGQGLDGVMAPQGTVTGLYAHPSLKAVMALAVLQIALLLARYYRGGRLRARGHGYFLAACSALACLIVAADVVLIPGPWADALSVSGTWGVPYAWEGAPYSLDGATLVMTWRYGAMIAMTAALASLAFALLRVGVLRLARRRSQREQDNAEPGSGWVSFGQRPA